jgi:hypothetical protein
MAQKVFVEVVDDLDGEEATQTVPFALDGVSYEIDLSDSNAAVLRDELARFVAAAQRTGGRKIRLATGQSMATSVSSDRERTQVIRTWAHENGYAPAERGRISLNIIEAYDTALAAPAEPEPAAKAPAKAARKRAPRKCQCMGSGDR